MVGTYLSMFEYLRENILRIVFNTILFAEILLNFIVISPSKCMKICEEGPLGRALSMPIL